MRGEVKYYLGIDAGACAVVFAVIDDEGEVCEAFTEPVRDSYIKAMQRGLERLEGDYSGRSICGAGVTGSGRELAAAIVGADAVVGEIPAVASAVAALYPETHSIIKIGNRDAAFIAMRDGKTEDFSIGESHASGIGAFIDKEAACMGMTADDLGRRALIATRIPELQGDGLCFTEENVVRKRQMGYGNNEIAAGICNAMADRYIEKVIAGRHVEAPVIFVGGVAANRAFVKILSEKLSLEIKVPELFYAPGAVGAAVLARRGAYGRSRFRGFAGAQMKIEAVPFSCGDCDNDCEIVKLKAENAVIGYFGDRCEKHKARL